jgi:hypothetical protein
LRRCGVRKWGWGLPRFDRRQAANQGIDVRMRFLNGR